MCVRDSKLCYRTRASSKPEIKRTVAGGRRTRTAAGRYYDPNRASLGIINPARMKWSPAGSGRSYRAVRRTRASRREQQSYYVAGETLVNFFIGRDITDSCGDGARGLSGRRRDVRDVNHNAVRGCCCCWCSCNAAGIGATVSSLSLN